MVTRFSRRVFLSSLTALAVPGAVQSSTLSRSLRPQLRGDGLRARAGSSAKAVIAGSGLRGDVVCAVANAETGQVLEAVDGAGALPPASVAKALTALYALDVLGPDHRFETRLVATGNISNGVISGDLILQGGGDPTLDTDTLARLAAGLKQAGIREVRGKFIVNEGALPFVRTIDREQPDHVGYSPAVSGIALNYNRVHFEWKRGSGGYSVAMDARTKKYRPAVQMARMKVARRQLPVYTYADRDGVDNWTVANAALGNGGARWLPVRKPALYAGDVFRTLARSNGIALPAARVSQKSGVSGKVVAQHYSGPLRNIVKAMLKYSTNITAEMVGMSASSRLKGRPPTSLKDSAGQMSDWAARTYGMTGTRLVDHSGLGEASRMTPNDLVGALVRVNQRGILRPLFKAFPMRDAKGRLIKDHPIKVDAKTGTLNFVSGLGGYMTAPGGENLAFAIFTADMKTRGKLSKAERERPPGGREWNRRSKRLQQKLIERWGALYGS